MIDSIRNTVLAILNKNNYGYLSPSDFNLYAKQAQLEVFENCFYTYNNQLNLENARKSGTEYANIVKGITETIDLFSTTSTLTQDTLNTYTLPSDYYLINKVLCSTGGVLKGEAERVSHSKITMLGMSALTTPSVDFPAYSSQGSTITVLPITFNGASDVTAQYIRHPLSPKWTYYTALEFQGPIFNQSAGDYQDFELPLSNANDLIIKICQYAGVEIRETAVVQFAQGQEQQNNIQQ
tara:strand:+ start:146 stop:859 length:714 start_codon:yes stop_codon:yes gene_type:complete